MIANKDNITKTVSRRMTDAKTYQFTYPDGKILRKTATGSDLDSIENGVTYAWGVDKLNRLRDKKVGGNTAVTYKYDERNNMIGEDFDESNPVDISYIYDDLNRLIKVKDGSNQTIATYTYDAFNRRITKTVGSTTERYSYDDWDIVEISTNSNLYTNIIDSGTDRHIAIEVTSNNTSTLYYFLTDERGNVTALTDANGNILERYRYRVYGDFEILDSQFSPKNCNNQTCYATNLHNFLWGGSLYEPETNLYWMRNRYYHIDMHRFINQDPIGIWGDANNLGNGFAYVAGMVIEASDPTGLEYTSDDELGKSILAKGNETSEKFAELNSNGNGKIIIVEDGNLPEIKDAEGNVRRDVEGAYFKDSNIYIEKTVAEEGGNVKRFKYGIMMTSYYLSPEATAAHEMAEQAELKRRQEIRNKEKAAGKGDGKLTQEDYDEAHKKGIEAEKKVMEEQDKTKNSQKQKEEEEKKNKSGEKYPSDPDNSNDSYQQKLMESMLSKILRNSDFSIYDQGPVVKVQVETVSGHPKWVFVFNPFYKGRDPMKQMFWGTRNADGTKGFVRNPFAPKGEYGYDATTYENWQNKGFPQTNVDPYWY